MILIRMDVQPEAVFRVAVASLLACDSADLRFTALAGGVSSDIWRVDGPKGTVCAKRALPRLRVQALWEAPVSRNAEEVRWLQTVRTWIGEQAAEVIAHDGVSGIALLRWYDPGEWHNWKIRLLAGNVDLRIADALGQALGAIAVGAMQQPTLADAFANADLFDALRVDPFFRHVLPLYPGLASLVQHLETSRMTLVHGDFSPKNILCRDDGAIRIVDAETATWGSAGFDPGYLIAHLLLKHAHSRNPALLQAAQRFWSHYRQKIDGAFPEIARLTTATIIGMLLARVDGKSPVEYLTRTERDQIRQRATALLASETHPSPEVLLAHWGSGEAATGTAPITHNPEQD